MPDHQKLHRRAAGRAAPSSDTDTPSPRPEQYRPAASVHAAVAADLAMGPAIARATVRREHEPVIGRPERVTVKRGDEASNPAWVPSPWEGPGRARSGAVIGKRVKPAPPPGPRPGSAGPGPEPAGPRPGSAGPKPEPAGPGPEPAAVHGGDPPAASGPQPAPAPRGKPAPPPGSRPAAAPTLAAILIPGVEAALETTAPQQAVAGYEKYAGTLLQATQRHDQRIESYGRFVEADHARLAKWHTEYLHVGDGPKDAKKKRELEDKVGAKKLPADGRAAVWDIVFDIAEERSRLAQVARANADEDVPLVDAVYERARDAKKAFPKGKSAVAGDAAIAAAQGLGSAVREAKLSEGRLFVKVSELEHHKKAIEDAVSAGDWVAAKGKWLAKKGAGAAYGIATGGLGGTEDTGADGAERLGMKTTVLWDRIAAEFEKIRVLEQKKPYGRATSFHLALQSFNVVVNEIRDMAANLATLCAGLGLAVALFAPPVALVLKTIGVALTILALGLTALKVAINAILATWSAIRRLSTSNARNKNLLEGQAQNQAVEMAADAIVGGVGIAGPALANVGQLGSHGAAHYLNPLQPQVNGMNLSSSVSQAGGSTWGAIGQAAATKGMPGVGRLGAKALRQGGQDEMAKEMSQHRAVTRPSAPAPRRDGAAPGPVVEPAWIKQARESQKSTATEGIGQLVAKHHGQLQTFHEKTQLMMKPLVSVKANADAAKAKIAAAKRGDQDGALGKTRALAGEFVDVLAQMRASSEELAPAVVEQEALVFVD